MKYLKLFGVFLIFVVISTLILSFFLPVTQKISRSVSINAPAAVIYARLDKLAAFNSWSIWNRQDSSVVHTLQGTDGTVGATTSWKGSKEISGEGEMEIKALVPYNKVEHEIRFLSPRKATASSLISLNEDKNTTLVKWDFEMATPRPWNIFNLFYSMDKQMGKDFSAGLEALKVLAEADGKKIE